MTLTLSNDVSLANLPSSSVTKVSLTLTTKTTDDDYNTPCLLAKLNETTIADYEQTSLGNEQIEHCWSVDRNILTYHSPYFAAMLGYDFYESTVSIIGLPSTILTSYGITSVIQHMYHTRDQTSKAGWLAIYDQNDKQPYSIGHTISKQDKLQLLQDTYSAGDYFGMTDLCIQVADALGKLVHDWTCHCEDCLHLIPQLFYYLDTKMIIFNNNTTSINHIINSIVKNAKTTVPSALTLLQNDHLNRLYTKSVLSLTHDPEKCLPTFWTHRMMARVLDQLPNDHALMLSQRLCKRINKSNAIESLHACFLASSQLSTLDPLLCWSRSLHSTLATAQAKATLYIARHFEYYSSVFPALLSCIDGITYSFDFLEYLFMHVLEDQMDLMNAGLLYQGLVRDLICRHSVQYNGQVRHTLSVAKDIILQYMSTRLDQMRKMAALDNLDTDTLKVLAIDLDVPAKSLVRSLERHQGLVQQSLLTILFPPPKISYPSSSSASINMSRRGSTITHRTRSLQSNATSTYSASNYKKRMSPSSSSPAILQWVKDWIGDNQHQPQPQPNINKSSSTKSTLFSWTTVPLRSPKKKRGWIHRIMHSDVLMNKQAQRKAMIVVVGKRVQLNRRPVLTVGTVKYVGKVCFAEGIWVGVELDRRVGKNDGSIDGERYFTTSPNRGVFVRSDDLKVMF